MKKLLALILCVMMFVAVIPTAAFAVTIPTTYVPTVPAGSGYVPTWYAKNVAQDAVDAATDNIQAFYQTLAADKGVFAVVSAIDGVVTGISKDLWKDVDTFGTMTGDQAEKMTNFYFRTIIGNEIMNYMNSHANFYATTTVVIDEDGNVLGNLSKIDPAKYMKTFADAASKAIGSDKAIANIQAVITGLAAMKAYDDFKDDLDDLRDDIVLWNDGKGASVWATYFDDNGSLSGQWVNSLISGGDLFMDPFALIEPNRGGADNKLPTELYLAQDYIVPVPVERAIS